MEDDGSVLLDGKALGNLRVVDLKQELEKRGLSKSGSKKDLVKRLKQQLEFEKLCGDRKSTGDCDLKLELDKDTEQNEFVQQYLAQQQKIYAEQKEVKRLIELEEVQKSGDERGSDSPKAEDASDHDTQDTSDNESQPEVFENAPTTTNVQKVEDEVVDGELETNDSTHNEKDNEVKVNNDTDFENRQSPVFQKTQESKVEVEKSAKDIESENFVEKKKAALGGNKERSITKESKIESIGTKSEEHSVENVTSVDKEDEKYESIGTKSEEHSVENVTSVDKEDEKYENILQPESKKNKVEDENKEKNNENKIPLSPEVVKTNPETEDTNISDSSEHQGNVQLVSKNKEKDEEIDRKNSEMLKTEPKEDSLNPSVSLDEPNLKDQNITKQPSEEETSLTVSSLSSDTDNSKKIQVLDMEPASEVSPVPYILSENKKKKRKPVSKPVQSEKIFEESRADSNVSDSDSKSPATEKETSDMEDAPNLNGKSSSKKSRRENSKEKNKAKDDSIQPPGNYSTSKVATEKDVESRDGSKSPDVESRDRSKSPVVESRDRSKSPVVESRDRSKSPVVKSRGRSKLPVDESRGRSKSPVVKSRCRSKLPVDESRDRSKSPVDESRGRTKSPVVKSRGRSKLPVDESRDRSKSPVDESRGRSKSPVVKSRGRSKLPVDESRDRSKLPVDESRDRSKSPAVESRDISKSPVVESRGRSKSPVVESRDRSESPVVESRDRSESPVVESRDRSESPVVVSRDRSESPVVESRDRSESPVVESRDRSESPVVESRDRSKSPVVKSRDRTKSPVVKSRDRSKSPVVKSRGRSKSPVVKSREKLKPPVAKSRNRSKSPVVASKSKLKSRKYSEDSEEGEMKSESKSDSESSDSSGRGRQRSKKVKRSRTDDISRSRDSSPEKDKKVDAETPPKSDSCSKGPESSEQEKHKPETPLKRRKLKRDNVVVSDLPQTTKKDSSEEMLSRKRKNSEPVVTEEKNAESVKENIESAKPVEPQPVVEYVSTRKIRLFRRKSTEKSEDEPNIKKGKWGNFSRSQKPSQAISISTDSLKNLFPDFKLLKNPETVNEAFEETLVISKENNPELQVEKMDESKHVPQNIDSKDEHVSESIEPEDESEATNILFIQNLVRPFTLLQLKELLKEHGNFIEDKFWIDKIKSKCFVTYENVEDAIKTKNALNGTRWPSSNPKILSVEYSTEENLNYHQSGSEPPRPAPPPPPPVVNPEPVEDLPSEDHRRKEHDPQERRRDRARPVREWDKNKLTQESPTRERASRSAELSKSLEKKDRKDAKRRPNEDTPAKLLDDLFQKTKSSPCIYWLPLTEEQIAEREEARRLRILEREKRNQQREQEEADHKAKAAQLRNRTRETDSRRSSTRSRSPVSRRR